MTIADTMAAMQRAKAKAERERRGIDKKWQVALRQEREAEINRELAGGLKDLRELGNEKLGKLRQEARAKHYKARLEAGPQGAEQWTEAAARVGFVAAEVSTLEPEVIVQNYQAAKEAGDDVGAYLIAQEGLKRCQYLRTNEKGQDERKGLAAYNAARELEGLLRGEADAALGKELKHLSELQVQLLRESDTSLDVRPRVAF